MIKPDGKAGVYVVVGILLIGISLALFAKRGSQTPAPVPAPPPSPPPAPEPPKPEEKPEVLTILKGQVVFEGEPPAPKQIPVTKDEAVCQCQPGDPSHKLPFKLDESLVVDATTKGIANAVVWIKGAKGGHPRPEATVDQRGCQFVPHVALLTPGGKITLLNPDGIDHNFHWWSQSTPADNKTVSKIKKMVVVPEGGFAKPEFVRVTCDIHSWMTMWVAVVDSGFAAVTDAKGNFSLPGLPAGTHTLCLWHETLATTPLEQVVTVPPEGGEVRLPLKQP